MSDRDLEQALEHSLPATTPISLDQKILGAAHDELAARRRPGRGRRWAIAAAILVLVSATAVWRALDGGDGGDGPIRLADGGSFRLAPGSRHEVERSLSRLVLFQGSVTAETGTGSLQVEFPRGRLRLASGQAEVRVVLKGDPEMSRLSRQLGLGGIAAGTLAAIVTIQLVSGNGEVELDAQTHALEAPTSIELAIPEADSKPIVVLEPSVTETARPVVEEPGASDDPGPSPSESGEKPFLVGQVIHEATGAPFAGAEVVWCKYRDLDVRTTLRERFADGSFRLALAFGNELDGPLPALAGSSLIEQTHTTTDADGRFLFPEFPPHDTEGLLIRAEGQRPILVLGRPNSLEGEELTVALAPGAVLTGRLLGPDGRPVRGGDQFADLQLSIPLKAADPFRELRARLPIDKNGVFEIQGAIGTRLVFEAKAQGYAPREMSYQLRPGQQHLDIPLEETGFLSGIVRNTQGQPIAGAWIEVESIKRRLFFEEAKMSTSVQSDEDGFYRIEIVGDDIQLAAEHPEHATIRLENPGMNRTDLDLVLPPLETGSLSGHVSYADGRAAEDVEIILYREGAVQLSAIHGRTDSATFVSGQTESSDSGGQFRFGELRVGTYELTVRRNDSREFEAPEDGTVPVYVDINREGVEILAGEETQGLEIILPAGGTIVGQFFDNEGNPSQNSVSLYRPDLIGGKHEMLMYRQTDKQGRYNFSAVPEGTFAVTRGFGSEIKLVKIAEGETVTVNFGGRRGSVAGRLLLDDAAVSGALVSIGILGAGTIESRDATTDDEGRFSAQSLSMGPCIARVVHPQLEQTFWVEMSSQEDANEQLILWPEGRLMGRIEGDPLPADVAITVRVLSFAGQNLAERVPADYRHIATIGSADGRTFEVKHLGPGTYRVTAEADGRQLEGTFEMFGDQATVTLR